MGVQLSDARACTRVRGAGLPCLPGEFVYVAVLAVAEGQPCIVINAWRVFASARTVIESVKWAAASHCRKRGGEIVHF